jgi:ankyrin repeat protein
MSGLRTAEGLSPLGLASGAGCVSYIRDLFKAGFDINANEAFYGMSPLCIAGMAAQVEAVEVLLELGAGIEVTCDGVTPLMHGAGGGSVEIVKSLLRAGAQVNAQAALGITAVHQAAALNHTEIVEVLLAAGADPNLPDGTSCETALACAVRNGRTDIAKMLLAHGANLEAPMETRGGETALHVAVEIGDVGMLRLLVESGADVDAIDGNGQNALHHAARLGKVEVLRFLKAAGSWLHTPDRGGWNVLHIATSAGFAPAVAEILAWDAVDVNAESKGRATALHIASGKGFLKIAKMLVGAGANVNAAGVVEGESFSCLRLAVMHDKAELVRYLIKAVAEVDSSGEMLMQAARMHRREAVKVLLKAREWPGEVLSAVEEALAAPSSFTYL